MSYEKLTALLIEAIKELQAEKDIEIEALQNQIQQLQEQVNKLKQ